MDAAFLALAGAPRGRPRDLPLLGRAVHVPAGRRLDRALRLRRSLPATAGRGRFPGDRAANSRHCSSTAFRCSRPGERNVAKRFITLIDALYDAKVKLVASAEAEPETLGAALDGAEKFEFARAASRLIEMRSKDYLAEPHIARRESGDLGGLVET